MYARGLLHSKLQKTLLSTIPRHFSTAETEYLILNTVGPDRVGIVSSITKLVVEQGGNVGESQASKLGSHFGLMMLVSVPKDRSKNLQSAVKNIEGMNTSCFVTHDPNAVTASPKVGYSGYFKLEGANHPGIVHKVTQILVKHRLNIDKMKTSEEMAPHGGTTLFFMNGIATSPAPLTSGFDPSLVREELQELGEELNCDIDLEDVHDDEYSASFYVG